MDTDRGLARRLPPPPEQEQNNDDIKLKEAQRVAGLPEYERPVDAETIISQQISYVLKQKNLLPIRITMKPNRKNMQKDIPFFGNMMITEKHVISLRCDRGSSYKAYLAVQNELVAAYNELRDEVGSGKMAKNYVDLNDDQQKAIRDIYPQKISEAEPKKYGDKK